MGNSSPITFQNQEFVETLPIKSLAKEHHGTLSVLAEDNDKVFITKDNKEVIKKFKCNLSTAQNLEEKEALRINIFCNSLRSSFGLLFYTPHPECFVSYRDLFFDFETDEIVLVYKMVHGANLLEWTPVDSDTDIDEQTLLANIMLHLLNSLYILHEELQLVHRDIKPDNIIMSTYKKQKIPILIDFDLCINEEILSECEESWPGTELYAATSLIKGLPMTFARWKRADIVSLALTFYRLLTGDFESSIDKLLSKKKDELDELDNYSELLTFVMPLLRADLDYGLPLETIITNFKEQFINTKKNCKRKRSASL